MLTSITKCGESKVFVDYFKIFPDPKKSREKIAKCVSPEWQWQAKENLQSSLWDPA